MMVYLLKYEGTPLSIDIQQLIAKIINNSGCATGNSVQFSQLEEGSEIPIESPVKHAIIFIGQLFSKHLVGPDKNETRFAVEVWIGMRDSQNIELRNAVQILATNSIQEFRQLANSYGIGNAELEVLRSLNNYNPLNVPRF